MKTLNQFLEELNSFHYEDLEDNYADMLDELYGPVKLAGMTIYASVMRELDPIMFRCSVSDYVSEHYEEYNGYIILKKTLREC